MIRNKILVLTYWSYPDALIQTYTLPYLRIIRKLDSVESITLVTLEKHREVLQDSNAKIATTLYADKINWKPFYYQPFGLRGLWMWIKAGVQLYRLIKKESINAIHCFCTPPGAIGYVLSKITGCKLILDSYEPHAEAMVENGTWKRSGVAFKLLFALERLQTKKAETIIATTTGMHKYAQTKFGVTIPKFYVKPACVDLDLFSKTIQKDEKLLNELELNGKIVCVYAGKLGGIYLREEVFEFFQAAVEKWGDLFKVLMLTNHTRQEIEKDCALVNLNPAVIITRFVPHHEVPRYMALGNFGITPVKPVPTKKYCTPIKDGEYWALGLPIVIPANISDDADIILRHEAGAVLTKLTKSEYERALSTIDLLLKQPEDLTRSRIRKLASTYRNFQIAEQVYKSVYSY
ncbi:MAG: hypothetical protein KF763_09170 [Cyclobacteriaceae bacterium]|nr:hypothetical protein [Cyclobacteriaceae bacterium]